MAQLTNEQLNEVVNRTYFFEANGLPFAGHLHFGQQCSGGDHHGECDKQPGAEVACEGKFAYWCIHKVNA